MDGAKKRKTGYATEGSNIPQYRHIQDYYLSNSKTFQDGDGNGNFEGN